MKLYTEERYLLRLLQKNKKFNLYTVYKETNFSTGQIARFVNQYRSKLYIITIGDNVYVTPIGRFYIGRMNLFAAKEDRYWKEVPHGMKNVKTCDVNCIPDDIKINRKEVRRIISTKGM